MDDKEFSDRLFLMLKKHLNVKVTYKMYTDDPTPKVQIFYGDELITEHELEFSIYDQ